MKKADTTILTKIIKYLGERRSETRNTCKSIQDSLGIRFKDTVQDGLNFLDSIGFIKSRKKGLNTYYFFNHKFINTKLLIKVKSSEKKDELENYCNRCEKIIQGDIYENEHYDELCLGCFSDMRDNQYHIQQDNLMFKDMERNL
jgi:hypothetical protein